MSEELNDSEFFTMNADEFDIPQDIDSVVDEVVEQKEEATVVEPEVYEPQAEDTADWSSDEEPLKDIPALGSVANGAIGVTTAPQPSKKSSSKKVSDKKVETVAIHSTKNVTWNGVGKVYRGYNIVEKDAADKWATRDHIRIATPEEVAKEFGKK